MDYFGGGGICYSDTGDDSGLLDFLHTHSLNTLWKMAGVATIGLMIFNKRTIENAKKTGKVSEPFTKELIELVAGVQVHARVQEAYTHEG